MSRREIRHRLHPSSLVKARELRAESTPMEERLWSRLRNRQLFGLKFRRQFAIGKYIADFACPQAKLAIELDGASHLGREERDDLRTVAIGEAGYRVVRFLNEEVKRDVEDVVKRIARECDVPGSGTVAPHPNPLPEGERE
jgi:very-short-patch-repair endonuclease